MIRSSKALVRRVGLMALLTCAGFILATFCPATGQELQRWAGGGWGTINNATSDMRSVNAYFPDGGSGRFTLKPGEELQLRYYTHYTVVVEASQDKYTVDAKPPEPQIQNNTHPLTALQERHYHFALDGKG